MEGFKFIAFVLFLLGFQLYAVHCQNCETERNASGKIFSDGKFSSFEKCWTIPVPADHVIRLKFESINSNLSCVDDYVKITVTGTSDVYIFCSSNYSKSPITAFATVTVVHFVRKVYSNSTFELEYIVRTGLLTIDGVSEAREKAVSWLIQKRTGAWGWRENTPRAVVALYLAAAATFNGTVLEEELMAKEASLRTAVSLLRPSLTNSELSMFINALLVTCHSPRQFYGNNLVKRLKEQVEESGNFTHPLAYLTLCNANESWPLRAISDLNSILSSDSEYPFVKDLQAMALMALSCEANRTSNITNNMLSNSTLTLYKATIQHFKKLQTHDGSFGNVYTTALITQALLSSGQELAKDWNLTATVKYLIKELNSPSVNFLAIYLTLPILNENTLVDISNVDCSDNPRTHRDDLVNEVGDYLGAKIRVAYSLYIGDEKDVIHSISLRVPENYTAAEVMELAAIEDPKYKFEWKTMLGKMYVYEIANITNDPEAGKFWLLYISSANSEPLFHLTKGPDEVIMGDGQRLILWYKTATI
ncbi:uncharacterized protein CG3556-like [Argiope bruennichi]|uniref:uncharacterized protein CG3556-like n=1 Tax=Argiope bruennichi TaxID=94029 RepID=UPI002494EC96|nr:uncharacterized protein CG3556-like [Argiope bruennichi]